MTADPDHGPEQEPREFAKAFRRFLDWVHSTPDWGAPENEVSALVSDHLGAEGRRYSVLTRELPRYEHVNLQTALDAWSARPGRTVAVQGIAMPPHYGDVSLQQMIAGEALPPLRDRKSVV